MVVPSLPFHQKLFKILGLIHFKSESLKSTSNFWMNLHNIIVILTILSTLLPCFAYFFVNITDIKKTTDATYIIAAMSMALGMYLSFVNSKFELKNLLIESERIMNESKWIYLYLKCKRSEQFIFHRKIRGIYGILSEC